MSWAVLAVGVGLVAAVAKHRGKGVGWPALIAVASCAGASIAVLELARAPGSWRGVVAFALLGVAAWLTSEHPKLSLATAAAAGVLQPLWLPAAVAVAAEQLVARVPDERRRTLFASLACAAGVAGALGGGQALLGKSLLAFRESLVRHIPDLRHENLTLVSAVAILLVATLVAQAVAARAELPAAHWLVALAAQLLVLGARTPSPRDLAVLPLLLALAFLPGTAGTAFSALGLAGALALANGLAPSAFVAEPALVRAERVRAALRLDDVLVLAERPSIELEYYAEVPSTGFVDLMRRSPGSAPLQALAVEVGRARAAGRRVWLQVESDGRPQLGSVRVTDAELGRIVWGLTLATGGLRLREAQGITSAAPCSAGSRPSASSFVEQSSGRTYAPERAVDGDPKTEWLALGGGLPWLDLPLAEPRTLRGVRLLDAQNLPYRDFETRSARVELYRERTLVTSTELSLTAGQWGQVSLPAERVECVRVLVLSHRGRGGGFGEVELY